MKNTFFVSIFVSMLSFNALAQNVSPTAQTTTSIEDDTKPISPEIKAFKIQIFKKRKEVEVDSFRRIEKVLAEKELCLNKAVYKKDFLLCDKNESEQRKEIKDNNKNIANNLKEEKKTFVDSVNKK